MNQPQTPEQRALLEIDRLLTAAGWAVQDLPSADIDAARGVCLREFSMAPGFGFADRLLYVDGRAAGVIEAKREGATLTGVEIQSGRYARGMPAELPAWCRPLPFLYESTGAETHFTNGLDPEPRARPVFAFHRPETLAAWLSLLPAVSHDEASGVRLQPPTFLAQVRHLPPLVTEWADFKLWPAQTIAICNLEASLAQNMPRALIQMATGSGKTFTAICFIYRLIKFAGARRVLFLVGEPHRGERPARDGRAGLQAKQGLRSDEGGNLGRQTKKELDQYVSPVNNYKFGEEYIVQHLTNNNLDKTARVCICTIQRMYSMLKGRELSLEDEEVSVGAASAALLAPEPLDYNPAFPIETFDVIVTDEAHRSIYNLWRQVLEYFDAHLIGLTAMSNSGSAAEPSRSGRAVGYAALPKQTFGFFNHTLVMEYGHPQAVADGVNVNYDVYRITTAVTEAGSTVEAGYWLQVLDKPTRARRDWQLDDDFEYAPEELDRSVQTPDQIRTIARTLRDPWQTDLSPQRQELPKTLVFTKERGGSSEHPVDARPPSDHAEAIVGILREQWGLGNEFAQKITDRTTGQKPEELIVAFRNSYHPRIAITVDMIATGTDIKPLEIVMFMRAVKRRSFCEQSTGRIVREHQTLPNAARAG